MWLLACLPIAYLKSVWTVNRVLVMQMQVNAATRRASHWTDAVKSVQAV